MKRVIALILVIITVFACTPSLSSTALESKYQHSKSYTAGPFYARLKDVVPVNDGATNVANIARSQIGYHEGASATDLSGVSSGKKDYCEYNYNIQNGKNLAWCSTFVAWCATQAGEGKAIPASGSSDDIYFHVLAAGGKKISPSEAKAGDLVFYKVVSTGRLCHCGIMTGATTSVEGNYSDAVKECTPNKYMGTAGMTVENGKISVLYLRPNYAAKSNSPKPTLPTNARISVSQDSVLINKELKLSFSAENASYYSISITDNDSSETVFKYHTASSGAVSYIPKSDGRFTATLKASNDNGYTESSAEFFVKLYSDVSERSYYYSAIKWATNEGITNGTSMETFSPNDPCTRAQAITMLWRASGSPLPSSTGTIFSDVEPDKYYFEAVQWAVEQGITDGVNAQEFAPNSTCTRAHIVTFIYRMCSSPVVKYKQVFDDVKAKAYYSSAVSWAVTQEITNGTSNVTFSPGDSCTRAQMATFLYRYYSK